MNKLFYGIGNAVLEYAYKTGSVWYFEDVDNVGTYSRGVPMSSNWTDEDVNKYLASQVIGVPSSFYLDASNNPVLSYYREDTKSLYLATKNPKTGTWEKKMIDAGLDSDSVAIDVSRSQKARVAYNNKYLATECGNPKTVLKSDLLYFQEENSNYIIFPPGGAGGSYCFSDKYKTLDVAQDSFITNISNNINTLLAKKFPLDGGEIEMDTYLFSDATSDNFPIALLQNGYIGIEDGVARMVVAENSFDHFQLTSMEFLDRIEVDRREENGIENMNVTIYGNDYETGASKEEGIYNYPGRSYLKVDVANSSVIESDVESIWCKLMPDKYCCIEDPPSSGQYKVIPDFYKRMIVLSKLRKVPSDQLIEKCKDKDITNEELKWAENYLLGQFRDALICTPPLRKGKESPPICESEMVVPCNQSISACVGSASIFGLGLAWTPWTLILTAPIFTFLLIPTNVEACVENYKAYFGRGFNVGFVGVQNAPGYIEFSVKVPFIKSEGTTTAEWLGFISAELFWYSVKITNSWAKWHMIPYVSNGSISFKLKDFEFTPGNIEVGCTGICSWGEQGIAIRNMIKDKALESINEQLRSNRNIPDILIKQLESTFNVRIGSQCVTLESVLITQANIRFFYKLCN